MQIDNVWCNYCIPDPYKWTIEHVQRWARWTLDQYNLPITHVDEFMVDGNTICNLTPAEFQSMSPNVGEYLFAQLEFWKSGKCAVELLLHNYGYVMFNLKTTSDKIIE